MNQRESQKDELFQKVLKEETDVIDLLELERPLLYDYLLRMTGQVSRSEESIEELYKVAVPQIQSYKTWMEFKFLLYSTARNFNSDIWNADTKSLENSALERITVTSDKLKKLDEFIKMLPGPQREILIGVFIYGLDVERLAKLLRRSLETVSVEGNKLLQQLTKSIDIKQDDLKDTFEMLPLHPINSAKSHNTVALSQVMEKMEEVEKRAKKIQIGRFFLFVVLLAAVVVTAYYYGLLDGLQDSIMQLDFSK